MAGISRRTMARAEAWIDKTNIKKLRKILLDQWVLTHSQKEIDTLADDEVRELMKEELQEEGHAVEEALDNIGIEVIHSDDYEDEEEEEGFGDEE